jgi:acetylornithine deacetylase/succinyl-diaminopimelate desuccinylase-like protein
LTTAVEESVLRFIETEGAASVDLLQDLVKLPSYSGLEGTAAESDTVVGEVYRAAVAHRSRVSVQQVKASSDNVIEVVGERRDRVFVLEAHTDIVPEGDAARWFDGNPFSGALGTVQYLGEGLVELNIDGHHYRSRIRDQMSHAWERRSARSRRVIYGRGAFDNKGSVVALLLAMGALSDSVPAAGARLRGAVVAAYTVGEESDASGVRRFACDEDSWLAVNGYLESPVGPSGMRTRIAGAALDGSYGWVPVVGHRGGMQITITVHGRSSHASTPRAGINAVEMASRMIVQLLDEEDEVTRRLLQILDPTLLGLPTIAVGTTVVGGGVRSVKQGPSGLVVDRGGTNAIPNWCEATLDVRFPVGLAYPNDINELPELVAAILRQFLAERFSSDEWSYEVEIDMESVMPPIALGRTGKEAEALPLVKLARSRAEQILGHPVDLEVAPGGTDATLLIHDARIPCLVELGPAGGLSHDVHEYVEVDDVIDGAKVIALMALDYVGLED